MNIGFPMPDTKITRVVVIMAQKYKAFFQMMLFSYVLIYKLPDTYNPKRPAVLVIETKALTHVFLLILKTSGVANGNFF